MYLFVWLLDFLVNNILEGVQIPLPWKIKIIFQVSSLFWVCSYSFFGFSPTAILNYFSINLSKSDALPHKLFLYTYTFLCFLCLMFHLAYVLS